MRTISKRPSGISRTSSGASNRFKMTPTSIGLASMAPAAGCFGRPGAEQEVDDVAFVRLQPVEGDRFNRADIKPVDVGRVEQLLRELGFSVMPVQTSVCLIDLSI